jgi:hypothetical protein
MIDVRIPETWENLTIHTFVSPTRDRSFASNITVAPYETDTTVSLEQMVASVPVSSALDDVLILERSYKTRGVSRYHERTVRFVEPQQGLLMQQRQRFVMIKRKPYIFTFTDTAQEFASHADAFDGVFGTMLDSPEGAS